MEGGVVLSVGLPGSVTSAAMKAWLTGIGGAAGIWRPDSTGW